MSEHKRHLRNFIVNRPFQSRICYYMVALTLSLTAGMSAFVTYTLNNLRVLVSQIPMVPTGVLIEIEKTFLLIMIVSALFVVVSVLGTIVYGIIISHRMAGPMHAILNYIAAIKAGRGHEKRNLRPNDELIPIMESLHDLADKVKPIKNN